jgi:hypothetical protein
MSTPSIPHYVMALDDPGDIDAPRSSASWARAMRVILTQMVRKSETTLQYFQTYLRLLDQEKGYRQLEDPSGQPFASLAVFCGAPPPYGLGYDPAILAAIQEETRDMLLTEKVRELQGQATKQGERTDLANFAMLSQRQRAEKNGVSHYTQKKLDHLAGHRPDLLDEVHSGALSIDAAYQRAKGRVPETPFQTLLRAWRRVSREERVRFLREELKEEERAELAEELLAIEAREV